MRDVLRGYRVVLVLLLLAGLHDRALAQQCRCSCRESNQCGFLQWCGPQPWECTPWTSDVTGKYLTGQCSVWNYFEVSPGINTPISQALDLWLRAFETAGAAGGGPPDPALVAQAESVPLPPGISMTVRKLALQVQTDYLGLTGGTAYTPPPSDPNCHDPAPGQNGAVPALDPCLRLVAATIRIAMVGELLNPHQGVFESQFMQIAIGCPGYVTRGRCTFPPPDGVPLPYTDGLTCLREETKAPLDALYATMHATSVEPGSPPVTTEQLALRAVPNPLKTTSEFVFALPRAAQVRLDIYDTAGRRVRSVTDEVFEAGTHWVPWDGRDAQGQRPAAGVYLARLVGEGVGTVACRITLVR